MAEILLKRGDGDWREPDVRSVGSESELQDMLVTSPRLIPGVGDSPTVAVKEFAVDSGYIDVVAVGADGSITVVECKLGANPEIRRHVIGQVFAYAASLWRLTYEDFESAFQSRWGRQLDDAEHVFGADWSYGEFRRSVAETLASGSFRVVIAVDEITEELKNTVLYLNQHTVADLEVLALEAGLVRDGDVQILIPVVYGEESAKAKRSASRARWTRQDFLDHADLVSSPKGREAIDRLLEWADARGAEPFWGEGKSHPSLTAWVDVDGVRGPIWTCYLADDDRTVLSPNFEWLSTRFTIESLSRLAESLRTIPEFGQVMRDLEEKEYRKRPSVTIQVFTDEGKLSAFLRAFDDLMGTGRSLASG